MPLEFGRRGLEMGIVFLCLENIIEITIGICSTNKNKETQPLNFLVVYFFIEFKLKTILNSIYFLNIYHVKYIDKKFLRIHKIEIT